jgi:hypothetical protein
MNMRTMNMRTSIAISLLALLCACDAEWKGKATAPATPPAPQIETATVTNGADLLEAFLAAFGQPAPYRATIPASEGSAEHALEFSPLAFINIAPNVVALVSKGEGRNTDYTCHACSGAMTMHYLKRGPQGFTVLGHWPIESGGAGYGEVNQWSIRTDLDDVPTMLVANQNAGMGCTTELDTLVALTPTGPEERGSFTRSSSYQEAVDVKNGPKDYSYEGKVIAIERGKRIAIDYSGKTLRRIEFVKGSDRVYRPEHGDNGSFPPDC